MNKLEKVTRYHCQHCGKDFKTPDRHYCKMDPRLQNCWTCKYLRGWLESDNGVDVGVGIIYDPPYPDCTAEEPNWGDWDIETIKQVSYDMQCPKWKEGKYDWSKERERICQM